MALYPFASIGRKEKTWRVSLGEISQRIHEQNELILRNYHIQIERLETSITTSISQIPSVIGDVLVTFPAEDEGSSGLEKFGLIKRTRPGRANGNL